MFEKDRALFVCSQIPSASAHQAGHKTALNYLLELAKTHLVDLVVMCKDKDLPMREGEFLSLEKIVNSVSIVPISGFERLIGFILGFFLGLSPRFSTRISIKLIFIFIEIRSKFQYRQVWLEFSQSFWVSTLLRGTHETIMSAHDLQTQVVLRKSRLEALLSLGWTYLTELRLLRNATTIRVQSVKDSEFIKGILLSQAQIEISRPALSEFIYSIRRLDANIEPYSILFWGAMSREENSEAIISFIKTYFHSLKVNYPFMKLYVVGSGPTREIYELAERWKDSIIVTGFVENPSEYFEKCSLGIAPLITGAGIKVKVLEMLEAKIPVLSTPVGSEGIECNTLLRTAPIEMFEQELKLLWG